MGFYLYNPAAGGTTTFTVPANVGQVWVTCVGGCELDATGAVSTLPDGVLGFLAVTTGEVLTLAAGSSATDGAAHPSSVAVAGVAVAYARGGAQTTPASSSSGLTSATIASQILNAPQVNNHCGFVMVEWDQATFPFTGAAASFVVPPGVTWLGVVATGGVTWNPATGGYTQGGLVKAEIPASGTVQVNVGGSDANLTDAFPAVLVSGFNGGAGPGGPGGYRGAGGSDVRVGGTGYANRLVVAGGAGGPSYYTANVSSTTVTWPLAGGRGGDTGTAGQGSALTTDILAGNQGYPASGATGGAAGSGGQTGGAGGAGTEWSGGIGGSATGGGGGAGGGGGGGYYGGGGGGAGCYSTSDPTSNASLPGAKIYYHPGAGGGGGDSYVSPSASWSAMAAQAESTTVKAAQVQLLWDVAPYGPSLTAPAANSNVDAAASGVDFAFTYSPNLPGSAPLASFFLRIKAEGGAYQYWDSATGTLVADAVATYVSAGVAASGLGTCTIPAGVLADGTTYNWNVLTFDANGTTGSWAATDSVFTALAGGTVTFSSPTPGQVFAGPPTVTVNGSANPNALGIYSYRVVVYSAGIATASGFEPGQAAGLLYDSGDYVTAASSYTTVATGFTSAAEATYWVYAQVNQAVTGGAGIEYGPWSGVTFELSTGNAPPAPTVSCTVALEPNSGQPGAGVLVTAGEANFEGYPTAAVVQRSYDRVNWAPIPATASTVATQAPNGTAFVVDYECPFNTVMYYRAQISAAVAGAATGLQSPWSAIASVTVPSARKWWLANPSDPTTSVGLNVMPGMSSNVAIQIAPIVELGIVEQMQVDTPLGATVPVIQRGAIQAPTFPLTFLIDDAYDYGTWQTLFALQAPLLLRDDKGNIQYVVFLSPTTDSTLTQPETAPTTKSWAPHAISVNCVYVPAP